MNILAIGAHPDDVEIGCGGMLIKSVKNGHSVYSYNVTRGEKGGDPHQIIGELRSNCDVILAPKRFTLTDFLHPIIAYERFNQSY